MGSQSSIQQDANIKNNIKNYRAVSHYITFIIQLMPQIFSIFLGKNQGSL